MRAWQYNPSILLEDIFLLEDNNYQKMIDKLVALYGIINAGSEHEQENAQRMADMLLKKISHQFGKDKASDAKNQAEKSSYKRQDNSSKKPQNKPPYKVGDYVVFVAHDNVLSGLIMSDRNGYNIRTTHGYITVEHQQILGQTRFVVGDNVVYNSRPHTVKRFMKDGNSFKVRIVSSDGLQNIVDEETLKPNTYTRR